MEFYGKPSNTQIFTHKLLTGYTLMRAQLSTVSLGHTHTHTHTHARTHTHAHSHTHSHTANTMVPLPGCVLDMLLPGQSGLL